MLEREGLFRGTLPGDFRQFSGRFPNCKDQFLEYISISDSAFRQISFWRVEYLDKVEAFRCPKKMEKNNYNHNGERLVGVLGGGGGGGLLRSTTHQSEPRLSATTSSDFVLQWGNRKRLRSAANNNNNNNGYLNLRQRPASPSHRILRNSECSIAMKGHSNGVRGLASPDRGGAQDKRGSNHHNKTTTATNHHNNHNDNHVGGASASSETAHDSKKGGSSSGSDAIPMVWPPKFVIALTNKEKEEDFMAIKGSKLPQRPKKRAKFIQRTLNLVSPGTWLCDLTLERYEVREKKISKKRPRGLKAMGNVESDSE
ncbi:hypothetical protein F0562_011951 [Nyssa sinensis]|uniref:Uncharacterized protein n=1 Tax=Nyssa sinensis TaxID=561372 RepID=A0A5J4ZR48_9ASTE|nr:hypothetical protein F0562_011951 [Nyssa sinensis]